MAHYAQLDDNNVVINVIVIDDSNEAAGEAQGVAFCKSLLGPETRWVKTSYNNNVRCRFAGRGYTYDSERDAFIPPRPFPSWELDEETLDWHPPVARPVGDYDWNEELQQWVQI